MRFAQVIALCALAGGCNKNPYFSDDEGAPRPSSGLGEHPDELSLPYALGTHVNIGVKQLDSSQASSYKVTVDDPSILSVDKLDVNDADLTAECTALAEGETTIHIEDGTGASQRQAMVSVRAPDSAKLYAHGPLRILGNDSSAFPGAEVSEVRVLAGGTAVYPVAYFRGGQRVYGRGLFTAEAIAGATVEDKTTSGAPSNEFLFITPSASGAATLHVDVAGQVLANLPVQVVAETDLVAPTLALDQDELKDDNQLAWVLAAWRDTGGHPVYGVYSSWTLDGLPQSGKDDLTKTQGDLYRYEYDPHGGQRTLIATRGALTATARVQAHDGWVFDTTYLGCSLGKRGSPGPALALALGLFALLALRRRS